MGVASSGLAPRWPMAIRVISSPHGRHDRERRAGWRAQRGGSSPAGRGGRAGGASCVGRGPGTRGLGSVVGGGPGAGRPEGRSLGRPGAWLSTPRRAVLIDSCNVHGLEPAGPFRGPHAGGRAPGPHGHRAGPSGPCARHGCAGRPCRASPRGSSRTCPSSWPSSRSRRGGDLPSVREPYDALSVRLLRGFHGGVRVRRSAVARWCVRDLRASHGGKGSREEGYSRPCRGRPRNGRPFSPWTLNACVLNKHAERGGGHASVSVTRNALK